MEGYDNFINENSEILDFIAKNDLIKEIEFADAEANLMSRREGNKYLHSYRYSTIYNSLKKNVDIENLEYGRKAIAIVRLLENEYNKSISEMVEDNTAKKGMEID